jgi:hypothetical protein
MKNIIKKSFNIIQKIKYKSEILKAITVGGYESPEPDNLPEKGKEILAEVYASCRKDSGDKEKCSKIAWSAVKNAGYSPKE